MGKKARTTETTERGQRSGPHSWVIALGTGLLIAPIVLLCASVGACDGGHRFPVCRSNADCAQRDGGPICFSLRCVSCQFDIDCPSGQACSPSNECVALSNARGDDEDAGAVRWDPSNWKECAEACLDEACLQDCSDRFKK
ncbi:hypothetical protein [Chondromyces crocatus]|uniref:hypothetical protein n=1 Tax=Chondromyces crocatus TaxID=52 RepID=UPI00067C0A66|nr:hypothetical protein [Chondromyces crocatus]